MEIIHKVSKDFKKWKKKAVSWLWFDAMIFIHSMIYLFFLTHSVFLFIVLMYFATSPFLRCFNGRIHNENIRWNKSFVSISSSLMKGLQKMSCNPFTKAVLNQGRTYLFIKWRWRPSFIKTGERIFWGWIWNFFNKYLTR